jgi:hypothetical protein
MIHQIDVERRDDLAPASETGVCVTRRSLMNKIVAVSVAAAIPTAAPAVAEQAADPIFAALDAFRRAEAEFYADHGGDIPDQVGDRWSKAVHTVIRTQPTTPAGLGALTGFARDMAERSYRGDAGLADGELIPAIVAIDDAARGMSGLKPWSPPQPSISARDRKLAEAVAGMIAADEAIDKLYRVRGEDYDSLPEYRALNDERDDHLETMYRVPSDSVLGLQAKASGIREQRLKEDEGQFIKIAVSLARDVHRMIHNVEMTPALPLSPSDAELIELGREFERLLAIAEPTEEKHERLSRDSHRLHRIKLGCDPEDEEAYRAIQRDIGSGDKAKWIAWNDAWKAADEETGRKKVWNKWNSASSRTARVGRKILKIQPKTMAGFLVRVRVIETHDEILKIEPDQQLLKEIRNFAKRTA